MAKILEIKDTLLRFYAKFDTYINMVAKFVMAFVLFMIIRSGVGYMSKLSSVPVALILALICCLLPTSATIWIAGLVILLDLYSLTVEAALVGAILLFITYFIYFRFSPKDNAIAILTPITAKIGIPYVMPMASGLLRPVYSCISICCGTAVYYYLDGVRQNASILTSLANEDSSSSSKLSVCVGILTDNKEMFTVMIALCVASLVVYFVRRMNVDYAWTIAIVAGVLSQIIVYIVVGLIFSISMKVVMLIVGNVLAILLGFVLEFFFMNLDYERVERVQFEDDDYYYYVKAVPKKIVAAKEKTVKQFGNTGRIPKPTASEAPNGDTTVLDRKAIAQELDIDEELLK